MQIEDIKQLVEAKLNDCTAYVETDSYHFTVTVVGDIFAGLMPVKKQQLVYSALTDKIADGSIHAVNIKTFTRAEWQTASARLSK